MKVGQQRINGTEDVGGANKEVGFSRKRSEDRLLGGGFEDSDAGGANRDDSATGGTGLSDFLCESGREFAIFEMHDMLAQFIDRDRAKGPDADMQREVTGINVSLAAGVQDFLGEMQSGGGRGDRARDFRVDRLVTLDIGLFGHTLANVGRQRDIAVEIEEFQSRLGGLRLSAPDAFGILLPEHQWQRGLRGVARGGEKNRFSGKKATARLSQQVPLTSGLLFQE